MSEWKEYKLGEIAKFSYGKMPKKELLNKGQFPTFSGYKYQYTYPEFNCDEGDLIIVARGVGGTGDVKIIREKCYLTNLSIKVEFNDRTIYKDFFYYFFKHETLRYLDSGSAQSQITITDLEKEIFYFPDFENQKLISHILRCIDNKINLLQRQNATLEKMAETLFRQWFVEEAKEEWKEGKLSDLVIVKYGKDHKKLLDGKIPVYGSGGLMRYADKSIYDKESVLIPRKGSLNNVLYQDDPFWTVDTMFYTEMKVPNVAKFVYYFVKLQDLVSMNVGSAVPSMTTEILNQMPLDIPPKEVFEKFEEALKPFYTKTKSNQTQIQTLSVLRDTLLPKLMSGEVKVEIN